MRFLITEVFDGRSEDYFKHKLTSVSSVFPQTDTEAVLRDFSLSKPDLVKPEDLPQQNDTQTAQIKVLTDCALAEICEDMPLLAGEKIVSDTFTFLARPHGDLAAGTGALVRRTNLAEICFLFPDVSIVNGGLRVMPGPQSQDTCHDQGMVGIVVPGIVTKAATMLLQKMATMLLGELFPDNSVPGYFQEVYNEIRKIVKDELTQNTVDEKMGEFKGILRFVNTQYTPEKKEHGITKDLITRLQTQSDSLFAPIAVVMEKRYAKNGLPAFLLGATIHLSMLQELAEAKRSLGDTDGVDALLSLAGSVQADYAKHAEDTFNLLKTDRTNAVVDDVDEDCSVVPGSGDVVCNYFLIWKDNVTGGVQRFNYNKGKKSPTKAEATASRKTSKAAQVKSALRQLTEALDDPQKVANDWRKLDF